MAGTIQLSMSQQFDVYGQPLAGGQLYIIQAGTVSTPQNAFQDTALTIPLPNPIPLDAAGRVPQFFLADGTIKIRLQDKNGVVQLAADSVLVIGPSAGGGGGGAIVDGTTIYQTGDLKPRYGTGAHPIPSGGTSPGWVRCNGLTIGSATASPSASERGNADCQALFIYLYGADSTLVVSGGRTGNALNDWNGNKTIALPDFRGRVIAAMDDMGTTSAARLSGQVSSTTLGGSNATNAAGTGTDKARILLPGNLPPYTPVGTITNGAITVNSSANTSGLVGGASIVLPGGGSLTTSGTTITNTVSQAASIFTGTAQGGASVAFSIVQPTKVCTLYIKL